MKLRWSLGIIAAIFLATFCLFPQLKMLYLRGNSWNGHYALNDIDEAAYASYIRALIDGRARKNDPYSGADESPETPQPESLFSIQFAAPYTIAVPARLLGIGTPWAMTISGALAGFLAALAAFWLVGNITQNSLYSMAASLVIFAGGALFAGEGAASEIFFDGFSYPYFPGFRRYIPALAMAAIFAMFAFIWNLLDARIAVSPKSEARNLKPAAAVAAATCFAYCVFSYFFIWTTAAAWLGVIGLLWIAVRPAGWTTDVKHLAIVGIGCVAALVPYAYLLSLRSPSMDDVQLLVLSRAPDLWRVPEYISIFCIAMIAFGTVAKVITVRDRSTLFTLATAIVPLIVFNQQIITGRSLQPIHYQVFIGNYVAGLALVLTFGISLKRQLVSASSTMKFASVILAVIAIFWGFVECHYTVQVLDDANVARDGALPVARRLESLAGNDPQRFRQTVLVYDSLFADDLPSVAPQNVLWARHQHVFAGLSWQQNKERYYKYLYFSNIDEDGLDYLLKNDFVSQIALFGWGRHTGRLSINAKPLTFGEIAEEVESYRRYRDSFNAATAADPLLSYVVVSNSEDTDMSQLDKWYERHGSETIGNYTLYRVRLRPSA
ncbi:MAG: hypothetical protein ACR2IH_00515 [Pyrinomonadaceae bacterium]